MHDLGAMLNIGEACIGSRADPRRASVILRDKKHADAEVPLPFTEDFPPDPLESRVGELAGMGKHEAMRAAEGGIAGECIPQRREVGTQAE